MSAMVFKYSFALLLLSLAACAPIAPTKTAPAIRGPESGAVDALFTQFNAQTPGCAVAVDHHGQIVHMAGYGMADIKQGVPIKPDSVFYAGSVSKQVVAMAAMLLVAENKIDLDGPISAYLTTLPSYADKVTTRQLLHHTSGIRDFFVLLRLAGRFDDVVITQDGVLAILAQQQGLNFVPGERYSYSNSAYFLISQIVNTVEGRNLNAFSQDAIFKPLAMQQSVFQHDHKNVLHNKAQGYAPSPNGEHYNRADVTLDIVGSGGLYTTVYDLILWDRNFYDTVLKGGQAVIEQMQASGVLTSGKATDYGFGLKLQPYRGLKQVAHSGSLAGYRARLQRFPEQAFTVALLCNSSAIKTTKLANKITDIYLSQAFTQPLKTTSASAVKPPNLSIDLSPSQLALYGGHYYSAEVDNTLRAELSKGDVANHKLVLRGMDGLRDNALIPIGKHRFYNAERKFTLIFETGLNATGEFNAFVFQAPRVSNLRFKKLESK